jgi:beta-galactosidase/beta-glucuronidase
MTRHRFDLNGPWDFHSDTDPANTWRTITVPGAWQAQFADLAEKPGAATYQRPFAVPADWAGSAAILHFGAVDYWAEVWVNGQRVGDHAGGYRSSLA